MSIHVLGGLFPLTSSRLPKSAALCAPVCAVVLISARGLEAAGEEEDERCELCVSSRLGGSTLSHHVTPSLLLLLPALFEGRGGGAGLLTYLYSRPLSRKRNKALSRFGML